MKIRPSIVAASIFAVVALAFAAGASIGQNSDTKPKFLVNVTAGMEDVHKVHMALEMAIHAQKKGRDVTVFFNVHGPQMALKSLSSKIGESPDEKGIKDLISELVSGGATILVCPNCLRKQGHSESDLADGVRLANRDLLFEKLPPGAVVFSY